MHYELQAFNRGIKSINNSVITGAWPDINDTASVSINPSLTGSGGGKDTGRRTLPYHFSFTAKLVNWKTLKAVSHCQERDCRLSVEGWWCGDEYDGGSDGGNDDDEAPHNLSLTAILVNGKMLGAALLICCLYTPRIYILDSDTCSL